MEKLYVNPKFPHFLHGGDYNPDQWQDSPEVLSEDMRLMKLAGCNSMTVGIFAWTALEPEEGKFDFSFLDKAMDDVYANGGRIVLATPSAARPAWLSHKYPEVLRVREDRVRNKHGGRHNHCFTSPIYREKVAIINQKLAERYANHPALVAWHLSNEYSGSCHCELCKEAFRDFLKKKYGTLDALNKEWWTAFWSHTYTDWSQIEPPSYIGEGNTDGLRLDWMRFVTHQTTDFMKHEINSIRAYCKDTPITTNLMGYFTGLDYRTLVKELDVVANDLYPQWKGTDDDLAVASQASSVHDLMRCLGNRPFMIMESTPSHVNWQEYNKLKRPGMHMLASLQAVAQGADTIQYFQWRKSRNCTEKFHGAVVDHVGNEHTRVFGEVAALGKRLKGLEEILGTGTVSRVAMLFDWVNAWAVDFACSFQRKDKKLMPTFQKHYRALWDRGINTDVIGFEDDFTQYDLIIAPMIHTVSAELEAKLASFVEGGGILLGTYMMGMVNENGLCHLGGFPAGRLKDVFGIWNEEIDTLYPDERNTVLRDGKSYTAVDYCEVVHPTTAEVLATYGEDFYKGCPALTVNQYGKGRAYYLACRDTGELTDALTEELLAVCGITSDFDGELPNGVTAHSRTDGEHLYLFLQNFNRERVTLTTQTKWVDLEKGTPVTGDLVLDAYGTLILKR